MLFDAIVQEDGVLVAKVPQSFSGKKVKISIYDDARQSLTQWEKMSGILREIDALNLPRREFSDILQELRAFKETE